MLKELKQIFGNGSGIDDKSLDFLARALEKGNLEGFDYLEFKLSLNRMSQLGMDQEVAFKSAFATATTVGLSKEKLISSAQHYQGVLAKEKQQFDKALLNQLNKRVKSKKAEVEKLKGQIGLWQEQINKLQNLIATSQATIDSADQNIQSEMDKIEQTKESFENTHKAILGHINDDLAAIQKFI